MMEQPRFFSEILRLLQPFWLVTLFATVAGTAGGLASAWLLAAINDGLHAPDGITPELMLRFAALCLLSVAGGAGAGIGNSIVGQKVIAALRKDISARILRAPIAAIERRRSHRLLAVLTGDVDTVSAFTFNFSSYAIAFAVTIGGFVYLTTLSWAVFLIAMAAIVLGVVVGFQSKRSWMKDYEAVRNTQDELQKQYRALTEGAKELRLNRARRARVHGQLLTGAADRIADLKIRAMRRFWAADGLGGAIFFVTIGLLLALQRRLGIDGSVISGAVLVLLYVKGPVEQIVSCLPLLGQAQVAFGRIAALSEDLRQADRSVDARSDDEISMRSIELQNVTYGFPSQEGGGFELGPLDLRVERGETLFIVGENGSGKTTLIKLLLGLYAPHSGRLLLNGEPVEDCRLDDHRQFFSAVFSDYFLFDDLLSQDAACADEYLERLEIRHKVEVRDGAFTTTDLSTGQRKRLALIHAYLEQRPVMMFDEWAADQDPTFRRVFYTELLPDLKRQGKTLIIVSHDDRYFDAADRIIRLHSGKIVEDRKLAPDLPAGAS